MRLYNNKDPTHSSHHIPEVTLTSVQSAKSVIDFPNPLTLNALQSFLGNINWLRPWLLVPVGQSQPLFDLLKGEKGPPLLAP